MIRSRPCWGLVFAMLAASCEGTSGAIDAGQELPSDAGLPSGEGVDAGVADAGFDGGAPVLDAGAGDAGATDAGAIDAGATDAGATDAGHTFDAGHCTPRQVDAGPTSTDTVPPQLTTFTITPTSVDTSSAKQDVTLTATVSDDSSGVQTVVVDTQAGSQSPGSYLLSRTSGTASAGTYSLVISLPRYSHAMEVKIVQFWATDVANNRLSLDEAALKAAGFPASFQQTAPGDSMPPTLVSFTLSPATIDTSLADQTITATAHVTDDLSGLANAPGSPVSLSWSSEAGVQAQLYQPLPLISGTALDGIYSAQVVVPRYSAQGALRFSLNLNDQAQNAINWDTSSLIDAGFAGQVTQSAPGDVTPPALVSLSIAPPVIDTSSAERTVQLLATLTDDLAGLPGGFTAALSQPDCQQRSVIFNFASRQGNQFTYAATITMPKGSAPGRSFLTLRLADVLNNRVVLGPAELDARGLPTGFDVQ